jgi:predicted amidohydrolase YtcJ
MKRQLLLALFLFGLVMTAFAQNQTPDTIFVNADVYPGAHFVAGPDGALTAQRVGERAQAIAVGGGRVIAVGTNDDIRKLKGGKTQVVDLGGHFVMPGFNDAHTHLAGGGEEKMHVELAGTKSLQEMQQRLAAGVKNLAPGEWLIGRGWDETKWTDQKLPSRQDLDAVTGNHPAFCTRADGHAGVANSAAVKAAGITKQTPDPQGGKIDHDASGEPTGYLRDTAEGLVDRKIPPPTPSQRKRAMELALADAAQHGVTSAQDNSGWQDFLVMEELENAGKLPIRVTEWLAFDAPVSLLDEHRAHHPANDPMLHTGMLKGFMDGSLGSHTAALLAAYADEPGNSGLPRYDQSKLTSMAIERALAGFQMGFHAIGDKGAQMALDAYREAERTWREKNPGQKRDFRFRVEHAQVITPDQFKEFHDLGVIASMQPNHLLTDMFWAVKRIGEERAKTSYGWAQFLRSGVHLAYGTDYPVEPITPFRGVYASITRKDEAGTAQYHPEQKLDIDTTIAAYTNGSAYAEFAEREKGTLEPGKLADFIVLDRDITRVPPADILKTTVLRTVVNGKTVYEGGKSK